MVKKQKRQPACWMNQAKGVAATMAAMFPTARRIAFIRPKDWGPNQGRSIFKAGTNTPAAPSPINPLAREAMSKVGARAKRSAPRNSMKVQTVTTLRAPKRSVRMPIIGWLRA